MSILAFIDINFFGLFRWISCIFFSTYLNVRLADWEQLNVIGSAFATQDLQEGDYFTQTLLSVNQLISSQDEH